MFLVGTRGGVPIVPCPTGPERRERLTSSSWEKANGAWYLVHLECGYTGSNVEHRTPDAVGSRKVLTRKLRHVRKAEFGYRHI